MRDLKTLRELVAANEVSCKPSKPKFLDVVIAHHAPELYSKQELDRIKYCRKLLLRAESKLLAKNLERETKKRQIEEISKEEESVMSMNKRPRNIIILVRNNKASPDLPEKFNDLKFVLHKKLNDSNVNRGNSSARPIRTTRRPTHLKDYELVN